MIFGIFKKEIPHSYKNTFLAIGKVVEIYASVVDGGVRHYLVKSNQGTPRDFERNRGAGALMQWGASKQVLEIFDGYGETGNQYEHYTERLHRLQVVQNHAQQGNRAKLMWVDQKHIELILENKMSKNALEKVE